MLAVRVIFLDKLTIGIHDINWLHGYATSPHHHLPEPHSFPFQRGSLLLTDLIKAALRWKYGDVSVKSSIRTARHFAEDVTTSGELRKRWAQNQPQKVQTIYKKWETQSLDFTLRLLLNKNDGLCSASLRDGGKWSYFPRWGLLSLSVFGRHSEGRVTRQNQVPREDVGANSAEYIREGWVGGWLAASAIQLLLTPNHGEPQGGILPQRQEAPKDEPWRFCTLVCVSWYRFSLFCFQYFF